MTATRPAHDTTFVHQFVLARKTRFCFPWIYVLLFDLFTVVRKLGTRTPNISVESPALTGIRKTIYTMAKAIVRDGNIRFYSLVLV